MFASAVSRAAFTFAVTAGFALWLACAAVDETRLRALKYVRVR